jgi:hypothetical protein
MTLSVLVRGRSEGTYVHNARNMMASFTSLLSNHVLQAGHNLLTLCLVGQPSSPIPCS